MPPDLPHPNTRTIGLADYEKLVHLLDEAFGGTAQPGRDLPILYAEFGVETTIPPYKANLYEGEEPRAERSTSRRKAATTAARSRSPRARRTSSGSCSSTRTTSRC